LLSIQGKELYVETAGPTDAPALIYLHGGPGAGSYDFAATQRERLAQGVRLIMLDQRGVLRSAPLAEGDTCTLRDLIEDVEALRDALGVRAWSFIGHSFGGYLGLYYALTYPRSVRRVIFENPTFDLDSSARELMRGAGDIYARLGDETNALACREAAASPTTPRQTWERFGELVNSMPNRDELYFHGDPDAFNRLVQSSGLPQEQWARGGAHQRKLFDEGAVFEGLKSRLPELASPALMIHGAFDHVAAPDQIEAFATGANRSVATFENSAHFAHIEVADLYARTVLDFVTV
jgi:proline iminopeptidase